MFYPLRGISPSKSTTQAITTAQDSQNTTHQKVDVEVMGIVNLQPPSQQVAQLRQRIANKNGKAKSKCHSSCRMPVNESMPHIMLYFREALLNKLWTSGYYYAT